MGVKYIAPKSDASTGYLEVDYESVGSDDVRRLLQEVFLKNGFNFNDNEHVEEIEINYAKMLKKYIYPNNLSLDEFKLLMNDLKELTKDFIGVQFASFILASVKNRIFSKRPTFELLVKLGLNGFGAKSGYYKAYNEKNKYYKDDYASDEFTQWCDKKIKELIEKHNFIIR